MSATAFVPSRSTGILLMLTALSCFTLLDTIAKKLMQTNPVAMVAWARYFFHVLLMVIFLGPRLRASLILTNRPKLQFLRGLFLGGSSIFFFSSLSLMPLAEASSISMTAPIMMSALAVWLLKEKASRATWLALCVSLAGVLLIVRPGSSVFTWAALLPLLSAVCFAGYQLSTRKLSGVDPAMTTLFLGAVGGLFVLSVMVPFYWHLPQSWFEALGFIGMGAIGAVGHSLLIRAYDHAGATTIAPFIYLQIVMALFSGWLVFGQFPDQLALLGMTIVISSGVLLALASRRQG